LSSIVRGFLLDMPLHSRWRNLHLPGNAPHTQAILMQLTNLFHVHCIVPLLTLKLVALRLPQCQSEGDALADSLPFEFLDSPDDVKEKPPTRSRRAYRVLVGVEAGGIPAFSTERVEDSCIEPNKTATLVRGLGFTLPIFSRSISHRNTSRSTSRTIVLLTLCMANY